MMLKTNLEIVLFLCVNKIHEPKIKHVIFLHSTWYSTTEVSKTNSVIADSISIVPSGLFIYRILTYIQLTIKTELHNYQLYKPVDSRDNRNAIFEFQKFYESTYDLNPSSRTM